MDKKLGYYSCNGIEFATKLDALLYAQKKNLPIQWHFNDETFNSYDWSVEPELSLDTLYDMRAKQLREKYDYIILSFSGGSDSNNMVQSFLRQGLLIDEIITSWSLDVTEKYLDLSGKETSPWNNNAEFELHTRSRLEYIKNKSPQTKITLIDSSKMLLDGLLNSGDAGWIQNKNDVFNVTGAYQWNPIYFNDIRKRFDKQQKVAYIMGVDKPKLMVINGGLYLYFIDKVANIVSPQEHLKEYNNTEIEYFYWSPENCDLICKQAHIVFKILQCNPHYLKLWKNKDRDSIRRGQEQLLRNMIYTTWNSDWFQVKKPLDDWDSELDKWFTQGMAGSKEHFIWREGLKFIVPKISNFLERNSDNSIRGTKPYFSKFHHIGNFSNTEI
jgi:hypothetical protein